MDKTIEKFVTGRSFAIAGVSKDSRKFGNAIVKELVQKNAVRVVKEAAVCGFNLVWLQQGCGSDAVVEAAKGAGLEVVSGKCILMYTEPVGGFHKFHRGVNNLFGKY